MIYDKILVIISKSIFCKCVVFDWCNVWSLRIMLTSLSTADYLWDIYIYIYIYLMIYLQDRKSYFNHYLFEFTIAYYIL